jgi:hypothetical protein
MINQFKCPKDKAIILINFCNILSSMVNNRPKRNNMSAGADEVYPLIVYTLLKSGIRKLKSNISYIKMFRHPVRLSSQEEYYHTAMDTAVGFLENMSAKDLGMGEAEFNEHLARSEQEELEMMKVQTNPVKSKIIR